MFTEATGELNENPYQFCTASCEKSRDAQCRSALFFCGSGSSISSKCGSGSSISGECVSGSSNSIDMDPIGLWIPESKKSKKGTFYLKLKIFFLLFKIDDNFVNQEPEQDLTTP